MLYNFFKKSLGDWISHRSYFYANKKEVVNSITEFSWKELTNKSTAKSFLVSWDNEVQNSKGSFEFSFNNNYVIERSEGYFTKEKTKSYIVNCSNTYLKTVTTYGNMEFVETIEFITDTIRVRRTIANKYNKQTNKFDKLFLIGNYIEYKKECN